MAVVDRVVDAERAQRVVLERGRRADDRRAAQPRELRRGNADAAAGVVHEHRLADVERRHPVERERGRQVVHRDRGSFRVAQALGDMEGVPGGHHHGVGIAAEPRQRKHAIAFAETGDRPPDAVDVPDDFVADHHRRLGRVRVESEPGQDVREVHARRTHPDSDLAFAGRRIGARPHLEDIRRTVSRDDGLKHRATLPHSRQSGVDGRQSQSTVGSLSRPASVTLL